MQLDRAREIRRLDEADQHIGEAERRITAQAVRVERLRAEGYDVRESVRLLTNLEGVLAGLLAHRALIVEMIRRIDAGEVRAGDRRGRAASPVPRRNPPPGGGLPTLMRSWSAITDPEP